ncbi:MAG: hypothetical protein IRD7MM_06555 [Candidatus Midichloria mitochondrii]
MLMSEDFGHIGGMGPNNGKLIFQGLENTPQKFKPLIPGIALIDRLSSAMQGFASSFSLQNVSMLPPPPQTPISADAKLPGIVGGGKGR